MKWWMDWEIEEWGGGWSYAHFICFANLVLILAWEYE